MTQPTGMSRPSVAVIATTYFADSHADVCGTRLIEGYEFGGEHQPARVKVASLYLEQMGDHQRGDFRPDIGLEVAERNGVPVYRTVAEAIGCSRPGVAVDGVIIIGEHGDYERNEYGQKLYPRRRLFDSAVATMIGAGRLVPVANDKHLAWRFTDAKAMYDTARRLGIPLLSGSTIPLSWRVPIGATWPAGAPMDKAVAIGYGDTESYGFHTLEGLQAYAERRRGGESGVVAVTTHTGQAAARSAHDGTVPSDLLHDALAKAGVSETSFDQALDSVQDVFIIEYADGLQGFAVQVGDIETWAVASRGPKHRLACQLQLQGPPFGHFIFLVRQIENLILTGKEPYPAERTLLTTGILDAAMHSRQDGGVRRTTPELTTITYQPALNIPDTGNSLPIPATI